MNRIFVCGDIHNTIDINKIPEFNRLNKDLTKEDILICAGDFGFPWSNSKEDQYWLNWFDKTFKATMIFVEGNHENFDLLYQFPIIERWGGKVHKLNDSVFHLMRGEVYTICEKKIFTFGGAYSIDKLQRIEGKSWWPQEVPSIIEENYGIDNLEKNNNQVDYIITHDAPFNTIPSHHFMEENSLKKYLSYIKENIRYNLWCFGHHHIDTYLEEENAICLYKKIIELVDE